MIEIKKVKDTELAKKICADNGVEWSVDYHIIATVEQNEVLQCAVFGYNGESGHIHVIDGFDGDIMMLDGLCRAILNIMDINGVQEVFMPEKYKRIAEYVGFQSTEKDGYRLELPGFFKCGCGK